MLAPMYTISASCSNSAHASAITEHTRISYTILTLASQVQVLLFNDRDLPDFGFLTKTPKFANVHYTTKETLQSGPKLSRSLAETQDSKRSLFHPCAFHSYLSFHFLLLNPAPTVDAMLKRRRQVVASRLSEHQIRGRRPPF